MKTIKNTCILINHHEDVKLFSKKILDSSDLYYKNYYVKLKLKDFNFKINELESKNFLNKKNIFFFKFKSNWFKDENNNDYTFFDKKFSIGNVTRRYISRDLVTFIKNYHLYLQLKKNYDKIFISSKESDFFKKFVDTSKNKFLYYKSKNRYDDCFEIDIKSIFNHNLIKVKNYFFVFRILQKFFKSFLLNKSLIFNDPGLKFFFKKKNYLVLNKINIFKSFYFLKPKTVKKNLPNNLKYMIKKKLIKLDFPNDFVNIFSDHVYEKLKKNLNLLSSYYLMINEMINFYRPKSITVPSTATFESVLIQYACASQNVEVILATDGSNMNLFNDISFDKKFHKKNKINVLAYAPEEQAYYKKFLYDENIKLHPLLFHLNFKKNFNKRYDLIILDYYWCFNLYSINHKLHYSYKILDDILTIVQRSNKKNIAIKFKKDTSESYLKYQEFIKKNILKNFGKLNIDFLDGNFYDTLNYSNIFIGDIMTSLVETVYAKKKYIIYSPSVLGYNDSYINKHSIYVKSKQITRSLSQLEQELNSKKKIKLKKKLNNNLANYVNLNKFFDINKKVIT